LKFGCSLFGQRVSSAASADVFFCISIWQMMSVATGWGGVLFGVQHRWLWALSRPRMRRSLEPNQIGNGDRHGPFRTLVVRSRFCGRSPLCGHSLQVRILGFVELTHRGTNPTLDFEPSLAPQSFAVAAPSNVTYANIGGQPQNGYSPQEPKFDAIEAQKSWLSWWSLSSPCSLREFSCVKGVILTTIQSNGYLGPIISTKR
jgi:hypothetical protein